MLISLDSRCDPVQQPAWGRSREFDITTRTVSRNTLTQSTSGDLDDDEEDEEMVANYHRRRKVAFEPSPGMPNTIPLLPSILINAPRQKPHIRYSTRAII